MRVVTKSTAAPAVSSKLLAAANRVAPFGGRYGNPWVAGAGMSPVATKAYQADLAMLAQGLGLRQPAGVTRTIDVSPEDSARLQRQGYSVAPPLAPVAPSTLNPTSTSNPYAAPRVSNEGEIDRLIRRKFRSDLYSNPTDDLLTQLFGSYLGTV